MNLIRAIKSRLELAEETIWDSILGIDTLRCQEKIYTQGMNGDAFRYQAKCYYWIWRHLQPLGLGPSDVFHDIGAGTGRLLCVAALSSVRKCVGIELSQELCVVAQENAQRLRFRHAPIVVVREDAALADYSEGTVFALFNPFGAQTVEAVLERICENVSKNPRRVRFMYVNPTARQLFDGADWLHLVAERQIAGSPLCCCYYENRR